MKNWLSIAFLGMVAASVWAQHPAQGNNGTVISSYHNCASDGATGNMDGYQTMSEIYKCDEGRIELEGKWTQIIERGWVYRLEMGRLSGEPQPESGEQQHFKYCPVKGAVVPQVELCGLWPEKGQHIRMEKSCTPGKRGGSYSDDCVCDPSGKSVFCQEQR